MKKIRNNVFETNSSSVHSLVINSEGLEPSNLKIDPKTDHIIVNTQYFGTEYNIYNDQEDKLSYLITYIIRFPLHYIKEYIHSFNNFNLKELMIQ